jgi:NodT family efflux transporter outer membrane factor (OMF) lipoprotein
VSGGAELAEAWWLSFHDPDLDALIDEALAGNFTLRAAWHRLAQAEAIARREGADLIPSLDLTGESRTDWRHTQPRPLGASESTVRSSQRSLGLAAGYELDLWGRIRASRDAAALEARATESDLRAAAISLSGQVAAAWYELEEQRGQLDLLDEQIDNTSATLKLIASRFRQGGASATDVLQQQQLLESRRGEREQTLAAIGILEHTLAVLVGRDPVDAPFPGPENEGRLIELPPLPATGVPAEAVSRRPDVQAAYLSVQAADRRLAAAIAERYPRIGLTGGLSTSDEDWRGLFDNWLATLAANLTAPLVDGGFRVAEIDRARAVKAERFADYGDAVVNALADVEDALVLERRQRALIDSLAEQMRLAGLVVEQTRSQYLKGAVEYLRVLSAQLSFQNLQRDLLRSRRELIGYRIQLHRALAGGWKMEPPAALNAPGQTAAEPRAPSSETAS